MRDLIYVVKNNTEVNVIILRICGLSSSRKGTIYIALPAKCRSRIVWRRQAWEEQIKVCSPLQVHDDVIIDHRLGGSPNMLYKP